MIDRPREQLEAVGPEALSDAELVALLLRTGGRGADAHTVAARLLDRRHRLLRHEMVSQGTLTASLVHPREVFRPALRESAAALLLVHNHPSGDPTPSAEDREVTARLVRAGELLGIPVLDHVVVA